MNTALNLPAAKRGSIPFTEIERRDSGAELLDRTSDAADIQYLHNFNDALTRHRRDFDSCELGDLCCDDELLAVVRTGDKAAVGEKVLAMYEQKLRALAAWSAEG